MRKYVQVVLAILFALTVADCAGKGKAPFGKGKAPAAVTTKG